MIGIIDYGMGNLFSVEQALRRLGKKSIIIKDAEMIEQVERIILPGVGAFPDAINRLKTTGFAQAIVKKANEGMPLLGICLGMQLLYTVSEEFGENTGLNLLKGRVRRFQGDYKIPHMGWNRLIIVNQENRLTANLPAGHVYFVHSYYVDPNSIERKTLLASTDYYGEVPVIVAKDNIMGTQFHPEKSGDIGIEILKRFSEY